MKRIIVRADDLGFSEGVNYGIEKACRQGIIKSVGIMPNMEAAKHGYDLIKDLDLCLGQHTNICSGKPITNPKLIPSLCDEDGNFKSINFYREKFKEGIDVVNLDEVIMEIEAQYEAFKKLTGKDPSYFEAHAVPSNNLFKGLEIVALRHNLKYLPMSAPVLFKGYKMICPIDFMKPDYDPYKTLKENVLKEYKDDEIMMMVCHPGYLDQYILDNANLTMKRPLEVKMLTDNSIKEFLKENNIEVISYDEL